MIIYIYIYIITLYIYIYHHIIYIYKWAKERSRGSRTCACVYVCVCVRARARACVCVCVSVCDYRRKLPISRTCKTWGFPSQFIDQPRGYGLTTRGTPARTRNLQILDPAYKPLRCSGDNHYGAGCMRVCVCVCARARAGGRLCACEREKLD
jgi:hypothetical protein